MQTCRPHLYRSVGAGALAGGMLWLAAVSLALAGDPIKFSTSAKKLETPKSTPLEQYLDRPFDSLKPDSSLAPVLPTRGAFAMPRPALPQKNDTDRTRLENSWIWDLPANVNRKESVEELFNLRKLGPDGQPKKKPTLMEEWFKEREKRNPSNPATANTGSDFGRDKEDDLRQPKDPLRNDVSNRKSNGLESRERSLRDMLDTENRNSWQPNSTKDPLLSSDLTLSDLFKETREDLKKDREHTQRKEDFQQMLDNRNFWMPAEKKDLLSAPEGRDNSLPTAMRELEAHNRANRRDVLSPGSLGGPSRSSAETFGEMPKLQLTPTRGAESPALANPLNQRERPAVLPIPKRQF